jgi:RNA polymerase sigma-70 factor (ECF subfamily)
MAAGAGDRMAFEELVRRTSAATYTLAVRLTGNEEDARDVVQETYLKAFKGLHNFRGDAQVTTWLYRVTANCANNQLHSRNRHRCDELPDSDVMVDLRNESDVELVALGADFKRQVEAALDALAPKLRAVVVLRDIYELPHEVIAEELGISVPAAKVRLHRARQQLREHLFTEAELADAV